MHPHSFGVALCRATAGANFHDNQINVGLYPREGRVPTGVTTRADAHVTNGAGYAQETFSLFHGRLIAGRRNPLRRVPLRRRGPRESRRERRAGGRALAGQGEPAPSLLQEQCR